MEITFHRMHAYRPNILDIKMTHNCQENVGRSRISGPGLRSPGSNWIRTQYSEFQSVVIWKMTSLWNMIIHVQDWNFKFFSNFRISAHPCFVTINPIGSVWVSQVQFRRLLNGTNGEFWIFEFGFSKNLADIWIKKCHRILMNFSKLKIKCQNRGFQDVQIYEFDCEIRPSDVGVVGLSGRTPSGPEKSMSSGLHSTVNEM